MRRSKTTPYKTFYLELGTLFAKKRLEKGISIISLAKNLDVARSSIYYIERGETSLTFHTILLLLPYLDIPLETVLRLFDKHSELHKESPKAIEAYTAKLLEERAKISRPATKAL